jgi:broad specificity phosphatase PhoE
MERPRFSPFTWAFFLRIAWLCGFSGGVESARAKVRANTAAQRLQLIANEGPVLLLGHGFMNRLIAKQLESAGGFAEKAAVRGTGAQRSIK